MKQGLKQEDLQGKHAKLQPELTLLEQDSDTTEGILDTIDVSENILLS